MPIPELAVTEGVDDLVASFADQPNGHQPNGHRPPLPAVSDDDRMAYGVLLDRAAERGLLSEDDYQERLGELAEATSIEEMRRLVTELPALVTPPPTARVRRPSKNSGSPLGQPNMPVLDQRRRTTPWVLLAVVVAVLLVTVVLFALYAEHLVHQHGAGVVSWSAVSSGLSGPRL